MSCESCLEDMGIKIYGLGYGAGDGEEYSDIPEYEGRAGYFRLDEDYVSDEEHLLDGLRSNRQIPYLIKTTKRQRVEA